MARIEVNEETLRLLAGDSAFGHGSALHRDGAVGDVAVDGTSVSATVGDTSGGAAQYQVTLRVGRDGLTGRCDCPQETDAEFCAHCVAVGLAWLDRDADLAESTDQPADSSDTEDDDAAVLRTFLVMQDPEWLADELLDAIADDPARYARLWAAIEVPTTD